MSLTSQLRDGALGAWCAATLPGVPALVDEVQAAARGREPVRPAGNVDADHWATIGGAFGQRLAFLTSLEPPYASYLGAANAGLLGHPALDEITAHWPTHRGCGRASELRPLPTGWHDLNPNPATSLWGLHGQPGTSDQLVDAFTRQLVDHLGNHVLPGQLADTRHAEETLACACWVLTGWENAYRGGAIPPGLVYAAEDLAHVPSWGDPEATRAAVDALTHETPLHQIEELVTLSGRLHGSGALDQLRALAANPPVGSRLGIAAPTFALHWADGDILIGDTLIDVKTVITLRDRDRIARWLFQLLSYAWLDTADHYQIRNVGLYLARHGVLLTWPLEAFAETLVNASGCVGTARGQFLDCAHEAMHLEGAVPFAEPGERTRIA